VVTTRMERAGPAICADEGPSRAVGRVLDGSCGIRSRPFASQQRVALTAPGNAEKPEKVRVNKGMHGRAICANRKCYLKVCNQLVQQNYSDSS